MSSFSLHLARAEDSGFLYGDAAFAPFLQRGEEMAMSNEEVALEQ